MILVRFKALCLTLGLLSTCIPVHCEESNHSLRGGDTEGGDTEAARILAGVGTVTIDFDEFGLSGGDYVNSQYKSAYGVTFSSSGGCKRSPRIFDTNHPGPDPDLGSPNYSCHPSGPGMGHGGRKNTPGENCKPLDNVLIIQECNPDMSVPDDNGDGGKIFIDFDPPAAFVNSMGILDNDYGGKVIVEFEDGTTETFIVPNYGDNGFSEVNINRSDVSRITLDVERSGAIAFITFRPGTDDPDPDPVTEEREISFRTVFYTEDFCFDPVAWCDIDVFEILMASLEGDNLTPDQFDVMLNGLQAAFCDAAASAYAKAYGVIIGEGVFTLDRFGGTVEEINLLINMNSAIMALADADASALATADAYAYAFAKAQDCSKFRSNTIKYRLCALAKGEASSQAVAEARAYASAVAQASSETSTNVNVMVNANRINEFDAQVNSGASNFVASSAYASASAFASAYAEALAKIKVSSKIKEYHCCRHKSRTRSKRCRFKNRCKWHYDWKCSGYCDWWTTVFSEKFKVKVEAVASAIASSFASAWADALASVDVNMNMRAYFRDANPDIVLFRSDNSVEIDASTQCFA